MKFITRNLILLLLLITIAIFSKPIVADSTNDQNTQTNTSGSNTNITGIPLWQTSIPIMYQKPKRH